MGGVSLSARPLGNSVCPTVWWTSISRTASTKRPECLAANHRGKVPAVAVDGVAVTERPAILALLADPFRLWQAGTQVVRWSRVKPTDTQQRQLPG
jgi:hypothetical protein